jgi:hypothetical protein
MRYSTVLIFTTLVILLMVTAGCSSAPKAGALTNATEITAQPASVVTTAVPVSTPGITVTTATKCPSGQAACADGTCRDTTSDHDACGGCGNVCPAGYICKASSCINPAGPTVAATQMTTVPSNPVTSAPTPITTLKLVGRSSFPDLQPATIETTYPLNTQYIDCSKYPISITSISPASGPKTGGSNLTIHGSGFSSGAYIGTNVKIGNTPYHATPVSNTILVFASPSSTSSGTVDVQVLVEFGGLANYCLSPVTNASHFTYV